MQKQSSDQLHHQLKVIIMLLTENTDLTELKERFGLIKLPTIILANSREAYRKKLMVSHFTPELLQAMDEALGKRGTDHSFSEQKRFFSIY